MKFKIDENLSESTKRLILERSFDCHSVHDEGISGGPDTTLLDLCRQENRHLLTLDLDFADIVRYPPEEHSGVIVLRLSSQSPSTVNKRLSEVLDTLTGLKLTGHLIVINDHRIRYR